MSPSDTARRYLGLGCEEVVVKNGRGPILYKKSSTGTEKVITLETVLPTDTTGAGDSFNAGFIHARNIGSWSKKR
ncbi:PfkB family carbohydrate kinase [Thalassospira xiamenensis]|uniref:PfkB family carbohydrate kinase n=1 Tax=Thalassospira xiamenensis TaxID=220697 RepID=UPI0039C97441